MVIEKNNKFYHCVTYNSPNTVEKLLKTNKDILHWCYINHSNDLLNDGTAARPHCHILLQMNNPFNDTLYVRLKVFGILQAVINTCYSVSDIYDYLVHKNVPHKIQYSYYDIKHDDIDFWKGVVTNGGVK